MTLSLQNRLELYMFSLLDQFGDDEDSVGLLDNMLADLIPGMGYLEDLLDFTGANEADSLIGVIGASASAPVDNLFSVIWDVSDSILAIRVAKLNI
jgi:hypothetical protein